MNWKRCVGRMSAVGAAIFGAIALGASVASAQDASAETFATQEVKDVVYKVVDGREIKLNLFLPTKADGSLVGNAPLLIDIVSGGWMSGAPGDGGFWRACGAVERGYAVASVSHRSLEPGKLVFPAQIEDVKAAVRFLRANATEYGLDPNRVAAFGASSGGHLASMLGLPEKVKKFDVGENLDKSSQVQVVVDLCCSADMAFYLETAPEQAPDPIYVALGGAKTNDKPFAEQAAPLMENARLYSPITYVDADFSPTIILQGVLDHLIVPSQSCLFYEALKRAGVPTELWLDNSVGHTAAIFPMETRKKIVFDFVEKIFAESQNAAK
ncbi:MAG: alpha/beta hydrolase [Thermoguttaceae bacterium]|nr:alpha/beta hydrolase [Thermoguttaceae bacterium]